MLGSHPRATINRRAHTTKPGNPGSKRRARISFQVASATFVL